MNRKPFTDHLFHSFWRYNFVNGNIKFPSIQCNHCHRFPAKSLHQGIFGHKNNVIPFPSKSWMGFFSYFENEVRRLHSRGLITLLGETNGSGVIKPLLYFYGFLFSDCSCCSSVFIKLNSSIFNRFRASII